MADKQMAKLNKQEGKQRPNLMRYDKMLANVDEKLQEMDEKFKWMFEKLD